MNILAVDDEKLMLSRLVRSISEARPDADIHEFRVSKDALEFAKDNKIDVAFLDIRMRGMDGLELARELNKLYSDINIIFCTGYDEYIGEAFREIRCNGYITKPVDPDQIREEFRHLRRPLEVDEKPKITIQCFGHFGAYYKGKPLQFGSNKTLELLAYLINARGGVCTNQEIMTYLWDDDDPHDSYFKKLRKDLFETLASYGCEDIVYKSWGGMGINKELVDCDFYTWLENNDGEYTGDYMKQYPWTEY